MAAFDDKLGYTMKANSGHRVKPVFEMIKKDREYAIRAAKLQPNFNAIAESQLLVAHICALSQIDCSPKINQPIIDRYFRNLIPICNPEKNQ